jgi:hypothetical protein
LKALAHQPGAIPLAVFLIVGAVGFKSVPAPLFLPLNVSLDEGKSAKVLPPPGSRWLISLRSWLSSRRALRRRTTLRLIGRPPIDLEDDPAAARLYHGGSNGFGDRLWDAPSALGRGVNDDGQKIKGRKRQGLSEATWRPVASSGRRLLNGQSIQKCAACNADFRRIYPYNQLTNKITSVG